MSDGPDATRPRVALIHDWLTGMRGGEKVLESLSTLFPDATLFTLFHFRGSVSQQIESHEVRTTYLQHLPLLRRAYRYYLPLFPRAIESFDLSSFDLVISSSHCVAKGVLTAPHVPHVCYCHTPVRYAWDQEESYFGSSTGLLGTTRARLLARLRQWDRTTAGRVQHYIANSHFVAKRIGRYYGRSARVLAPPVDVERFTPADAGRASPAEDARPFALSVAALAPYKKHDVAIAACEQLGLELRIVGAGPDEGRLRELAGPSTRLLGRVPEEELARLYREAAVFVQPGVEDFGIAAAEALACGTPVAARGRGGVRDIVVEGAHGFLAEAEGPEALAAAIDKTRNLRFNPLDLRSQAMRFAEPRFREEFVKLLQDLLQGRHEALSTALRTL